jgi:hypothetical protein
MSLAQRRQLWGQWTASAPSCLSTEKLVRCILDPTSSDAELQLRALTAIFQDLQNTERSAEEHLDQAMRIFLTQAAFDEQHTKEVLMCLPERRKSVIVAKSGIEHAASFPVSVQCTAHALADTMCDALSAAKVSVVALMGPAFVRRFLLAVCADDVSHARTRAVKLFYDAKAQLHGSDISSVDRVDCAISSVEAAFADSHIAQTEDFDLAFVKQRCNQLWMRKFQTDQAAWRAAVHMPQLEANIVALIEGDDTA